MAMEMVGVISTSHDDRIVALAYNRFRREIFSAAQGEKEIHVRSPAPTMRREIGSCVDMGRQDAKGVFDDLTRALFSAALDGKLLIWHDRETPIHVLEIGAPLMALAWDVESQTLAVGGKKTLYLYYVYVEKLMTLMHDASSSAAELPSTEKGEESRNNGSGRYVVLEKLTPPLVGPEFCTGDNVQSIALHKQRAIVAGYDGCLCVYDIEKPKETFRKIPKAHAAAISSLDINPVDHLILLGSYDGSFSLWSLEGRCGDRLRDVSDGHVVMVYVSPVRQYWVIGRGGVISVFDPSGPVDITESLSDVRSSVEGQPLRWSFLYAPPRSGILLGATWDRKVTIWNYKPTHAHRVFRNPSRRSIECLVPFQSQEAIEGRTKTEILAGDASGGISLWKYETEKCTNVFRLESPVASYAASIVSLVYIASFKCFAAGGDDGMLVLTEAEDLANMECSVTTVLHGHRDSVAALTVVCDQFLVSGSYDRSLHIWNLAQKTRAHVLENAHSAPIQCLESVPALDLLASCAMHHLIATRATTEGEIGFHIHRSQEGQRLLQDIIAHPDLDAPEVTQVRWVSYRRNWISAANDDMVRLWNENGALVHTFRYKGGSVQCLFVDSWNERILMSTLDMTISVYVLDHPIPIAIHRGHEDVVCSIAYIHERDVYMTGSWDGTLRLWLKPSQGSLASQATLQPLPSLRREKSTAAKGTDAIDISAQPAFLDTVKLPPQPGAGEAVCMAGLLTAVEDVGAHGGVRATQYVALVHRGRKAFALISSVVECASSLGSTPRRRQPTNASPCDASRLDVEREIISPSPVATRAIAKILSSVDCVAPL